MFSKEPVKVFSTGGRSAYSLDVEKIEEEYTRIGERHGAEVLHFMVNNRGQLGNRSAVLGHDIARHHMKLLQQSNLVIVDITSERGVVYDPNATAAQIAAADAQGIPVIGFTTDQRNIAFKITDLLNREQERHGKPGRYKADEHDNGVILGPDGNIFRDYGLPDSSILQGAFRKYTDIIPSNFEEALTIGMARLKKYPTLLEKTRQHLPSINMFRKRPRIFLATNDAYEPAEKRIEAQRQQQELFDRLDMDVSFFSVQPDFNTDGMTKKEIAQKVRQANIRKIKEADGVIGDMNPVYGTPHMDSQIAGVMAYADALGKNTKELDRKYVSGYSADRRPVAQRVAQYRECEHFYDSGNTGEFKVEIKTAEEKDGKRQENWIVLPDGSTRQGLYSVKNNKVIGPEGVLEDFGAYEASSLQRIINTNLGKPHENKVSTLEAAAERTQGRMYSKEWQFAYMLSNNSFLSKLVGSANSDWADRLAENRKKQWKQAHPEDAEQQAEYEKRFRNSFIRKR